jgi:hypothetical protein
VQKGVENDMFWEELKTGGPYIGIIYHIVKIFVAKAIWQF